MTDEDTTGGAGLSASDVAAPKPTILLVDTQPSLGRLAARLASEGLQILMAEDGLEALRLALTNDLDIALLEWDLYKIQDVQGRDVLREIRKTSDLPILVLTGEWTEEAKVEAFELGADDFMTKPVGFRELVSRINALLRRPRQSLQPGRGVRAYPVFGDPYLELDAPDVFVLMPFSPELTPVYTDHIRPVVSGFGLTVATADDFFSGRVVMREVYSAIVRASIVIADCTGRNPNVFYELGVAHTIGRPVVLLTQSMADIPFDVAHFRVLEYAYTPRGMKAFEQALAKSLGRGNNLASPGPPRTKAALRRRARGLRS